MEEKKELEELTEEEVNLVVELDGTSDQQYDKGENDKLFTDLHHLLGVPL